MEVIRKNVGFFYISLIIHSYFLFLIFISVDKDFLVSLLNPSVLKQEISEEATIVDTVTESATKPLAGMISDKPNINSSPKQGADIYNYLNPDMKASTYQKNQSGKNDNNAAKKNDNGEESARNDTLKGNNTTPIEGGDYHTSFFDPDQPPDVEMNNNGDVSLATIPESFASYFIAMEKKVGENWQRFFPIFQFYEGIIKSGDVVISFWVDENGNVLNPIVKKSYGYSILDEACRNAVFYSRNFGPLPASIKKNKYIKVDFKFIYTSK